MCGNTSQFRDSYITSANVCKILNTSCTAPGTPLTLRVPLQSQFGPTFLQTSIKADGPARNFGAVAAAGGASGLLSLPWGRAEKPPNSTAALEPTQLEQKAAAGARGGGTAQAGPPQGFCSLGMSLGTGGVPKCHPGFGRSQHLATAMNADIGKDAGL